MLMKSFPMNQSKNSYIALKIFSISHCKVQAFHDFNDDLFTRESHSSQLGCLTSHTTKTPHRSLTITIKCYDSYNNTSIQVSHVTTRMSHESHYNATTQPSHINQVSQRVLFGLTTHYQTGSHRFHIRVPKTTTPSPHPSPQNYNTIPPHGSKRSNQMLQHYLPPGMTKVCPLLPSHELSKSLELEKQINGARMLPSVRKPTPLDEGSSEGSPKDKYYPDEYNLRSHTFWEIKGR